jgi:hypothetical protein
VQIVGFVYDVVFFAGPVLLVVAYGLGVALGRLPPLKTGRSWLVIASAIALAVAWPFSAGVWLPDIFTFGSARTLARAAGTSGARYEVVQYWNYIDFYTTELRIASPDATKKVIELDGDDQKSWTVPLSVDEAAGVATVTLSGKRTVRINLREGTRTVFDNTQP